MILTKKKICKILSPGDTVYIIAPGRVIPSTVLKINDDCIETEEDVLFYDEHSFTWMFTSSEAQKLALKSQKAVV